MGGIPSKGQDPTVLQVFIFREGRFYGTECFAQSRIIMGRSVDVDLQLDDDVTSRSHAAVEVGPDGVVLEDLASSNGTYVNGEPIERCFISSLDEVSVGSFSLKFKVLSRSRPKSRFHGETRLVDRDQTELSAAVDSVSGQLVHERDPTEVLTADQLRAAREDLDAPGSAGVAGLREAESNHQAEIVAALEAQLESDSSFAAPAKGVEVGGAQPQPDDPAGDGEPTHIEQELAGPADGIGAQDGNTRWLSPQSDVGPPLRLVGESEPDPADQRVASGQPGSRHGAGSGPATPGGRPARFEADSSSALDALWTDREPRAAVEPADADRAKAGDGTDFDFEYDEEEELDQRDFVEPFSLLNNLIRENFAEPQVATYAEPVMEVIGYTSDKEVVGYAQIARGKKYRVGPKRVVLAHHKGKASGRILFGDAHSGGVITGGNTIPLDELKNASNQIGKRRGQPIYAYKLMQGDYANVIHDGGGSFIRFVNPPRVPPTKLHFRLDPMDLKIFGSSFLGIALLILVYGLLGSSPDAAANVEMDIFTKVNLQDIQMEKPEEEVEVPLDQLPEPEKKKEEPVEQKEQPKEEPKKEPKKKKPKKSRTRAAKKPDSGGGGSGAGMMAALGNLSQKKSKHNIVAAVSNLDAVRVPGGRSRYKVSGLVTKLPTSAVVTSRGRGVGVKGGIELLRGGKGRAGRAGIGPGALGGGLTGKRRVGGVVFKAPKRRMRVRGTLSREAIARVVRQHLKEIQYCYERNLLLNPKLAGKLLMEWTISTSGAVSVVKTKTNTMATPAVAMCVSANIKKWRFPTPKGGIVVVSYPFIFNSIGF